MRLNSIKQTHLAVFVTLVWALLVATCSVDAISCYVCSSSIDVHCNENIDVDDTNLNLTDCGNIHQNKYCIKTTGIFNGEMGTTRFCSSENLGTICDFQQRKGDTRSYRGCIYTCQSDGCNGTPSVVHNLSLYVVSSLFALFASFLTTHN